MYSAYEAIEPAHTHRRRPCDFMVWDNRCLMHKAESYDIGREPRVIRRCTVIGEVPAG